MVLKGKAVGQFGAKFHESTWYICLAMDEPETSLCETYIILGRFLHKHDPILLSILQNVRHYKHI